MPIAAAIFSCCNTFIPANSSADPTWSNIICAAAAESPFKANNLASSRFKFFPVSNSASNSADIDFSKSNNPLAICCVSFKDIPRRLAWTIALPNSSVLKPYCAPNWPSILANSLVNFLAFNFIPVRCSSAAICLYRSFVASLDVLLFIIPNFCILDASLPDNPICLVNSTWANTCWSENPAVAPIWVANSVTASAIVCAFAIAISELNATDAKWSCISLASALLTLIFLAIAVVDLSNSNIAAITPPINIPPRALNPAPNAFIVPSPFVKDSLAAVAAFSKGPAKAFKPGIDPTNVAIPVKNWVDLSIFMASSFILVIISNNSFPDPIWAVRFSACFVVAFTTSPSLLIWVLVVLSLPSTALIALASIALPDPFNLSNLLSKSALLPWSFVRFCWPDCAFSIKPSLSWAISLKAADVSFSLSCNFAEVLISPAIFSINSPSLPAVLFIVLKLWPISVVPSPKAFKVLSVCFTAS